MNTIQALPDSEVAQWVTLYFNDLAQYFNGDMDKVKAEMLVWEYAQGVNWTGDNMQLTNVNTSHFTELKAFKNRPENSTGATYSNWVVLQFWGDFDLAPDLIIW